MNQHNPAQFSVRTKNLVSSPIRDILTLIDQPGMISFAGGLPATETFPTLDAAVPDEFLQYGPTEGEPELRNLAAVLLADRGLDCNPDQILILSGSQQGIDLAGKLFIDNGTEIAIETPTYLAGIQVFRFYGAKFVDIGQIKSTTALAYINPTFQNPTGYCYTEQERIAVAERCDETSTTLFEDDPYHDIFFDNVCRVPICTKIRKANWIYQSSFSKSLAPGLRLGFMACSSELTPYFTRLKQAADLHSNRPGQYYVMQALKDPQYLMRLDQLRSLYQIKRDRFNSSLEKHFKGLAEWGIPAGGLFFWLKLNAEIQCDTRELLTAAISKKVAFMPGECFYIKNSGLQPCIRLNFSHPTIAQAEAGLARLAKILENSVTTPC